MLIIGAGGFAKEILEVLYQSAYTDSICFFDDLSPNAQNNFFEEFEIIKSMDSAYDFIKRNNYKFTIGIGNPILRKGVYDKFVQIGGVFESTISPYSIIGNFGNSIGEGCNILSGAVISNGVSIGKGVIVYFNSMITHDCIVEDFVELSPGSTLLGNCIVGKYSHIGANATILPKIKIGENVIVGAGAVVTQDVPANSLVVGVPAVIKKKIKPLDFD